jgi:hypothetical protein
MMLGEILIEAGALDQDGLQEALDWQVLYGGRLGTNLLELQLINEAALGAALRKRLGVEVVTGELVIDEAMRDLIPKQVVDKREIIPWKIEKRRLKLLCCAPDIGFLDELAMKLQRSCVAVVAPEFRIVNALRAHFGAKRQMRALDFGVVPAEQLEERRKKRAREQKGGSVVEEAPPLIDELAFNDIYNQILEGRTAPAAAKPPPPPEPPPAASWGVPTTPAALPGVWPANSALPPGYIFAAPGALPPGFVVPPGYVAITPFVAAAPVAAPVPAPVAAPPPAPPPAAPARPAPPSVRAAPPAPARPTAPPPRPAAPPPPPPQATAPAAPRPPPPSVRTTPPAPAPPPVAARPPPPPPSAFRTAPPAPRAPAPPPPPPDAAFVPTQVRSRSAVKVTALTDHGQPIPPPAPELEELPDEAILEELPDDAVLSAEAEVEVVAEAAAGSAAESAAGPAAEASSDTEGDLPLIKLTSWEMAGETEAEVIDESPLEFKEALRLLDGVTDRDSIAHLVLRAARRFAARALLLKVQGGVALGWDGLGEGLTGAATGVAVPLAGEGAFSLVVKTRSHFLGPLQKTQSNIRFLAQCGKKVPLSSLLVPILHKGRVSHLLYLDNGHKQQAPTDVGEMLILSQRIAQTVDALVERKRAAK